MSELTKEHFDQQITLLLNRFDQTASKDDLAEVKEIVDSHTTSLDAISKNTETWRTEAAAFKAAIERQNRLIKLVAESTGLNFEELLRKADQN